jgi:tRNA 2-thiouridine synthesizing protein A
MWLVARYIGCNGITRSLDTEDTTMATETAIDKDLNLQGEVCPYTFVKSKLALEIMQPGQVLRVIVDNDESASNVPRSMQNEGHNVLGVTKLNEKDWQIVVRKS